MNHSRTLYPHAVVAFAGARDQYQLPIALHEVGLLDTFVTDLYWPGDKKWFKAIAKHVFPEDVVNLRYRQELSSAKVRISAKALAAFTAMKCNRNLNLNPQKDMYLGKFASRLASQSQAALLCPSSYAKEAFEDKRSPYRFLFQLQADYRVIRRILLEEEERFPHMQEEIRSEPLLNMDTEAFMDLVSEPHLANGWISTSQFAAHTLSENGIPIDQINVVPYGVDSSTFPARKPLVNSGIFSIAYVGSLRPLKGVIYLLQALQQLNSPTIELTIYTRNAPNPFIGSIKNLTMRVQTGFAGKKLAHTLHQHDLLVFPTLADGFGHVVLEAMSCGIPVIATKNCCAADVVEEGKHGFVVPIRRSDLIAERIAWSIDHRSELLEMGQAAALQARAFTWSRFRAGIRDAYKKMVDAVDTRRSVQP